MNSKATPTVIGIDLGSSSTKLAAVERGAIDIITNEANFRETPSVVGYGEGERKIGESGNVKIKSNFKNSIISPLRYLGLEENSEDVKNELKFCPCPTVFEEKALKFKVSYNGRQEKLFPQQALASFFTQLSKTVRHNNLCEKMILIAVPSYFTQSEKQAVLNSAKIANLGNVELINEPMAIGLDYGAFKKNEMGQGKNVLFVDFGHSKLCASLIRFKEQSMEMLAQKHNRHLGCRNIDEKVFEHLVEKFKQKTGLNLHENKRACLKMNEMIQKQRKILTGINETYISIECLMEDQDFSEPFTRDIMLKTAHQVFEQLHQLLESLKREIDAKGLKIDSVELVGGGSRIPQIIRIIHEIFEIKPSRTINSSETIARGSTIAAVQKSGLFKFQNYKSINKNLLPISAFWKINADEEQYSTQTIFSKDQGLPAEQEIKIKGQGKVDVLISYPSSQETIGKKIMNLEFEIPEEQQVCLKFQIDQNGFVTIKKIYCENEQIKFLSKKFGILSERQIESSKQKQREMFVRDFEIVQNYEKKNALESFIYKEKENIENNKVYKEFLKDEEIKNILKKLDEIVIQISENADLRIKDYEQREKEIKVTIEELEQQSKTVKKEKELMEGYFKELERLVSETKNNLNYIANNFRNSRNVSHTYQKIKEIQDWANEVLSLSKDKSPSELPLVSLKDIQTQHNNNQFLMKQLVGAKTAPEPQQRYPQQSTPRRRQFTESNPFNSNGFFGSPRGNFFGNMSGFF